MLIFNTEKLHITPRNPGSDGGGHERQINTFSDFERAMKY